MSKEEIILAIGGGLLVNECCDLSPWVARRIVAWSARLRYGKSQRSEIRAEELAAVIDSRPGKLFKLITSLAFACGATAAWMQQMVLLLRLYRMTMSEVATTAKFDPTVTIERPLGSGKSEHIIQVKVYSNNDHMERRLREGVLKHLMDQGTLPDQLDSAYRKLQEEADACIQRNLAARRQRGLNSGEPL